MENIKSILFLWLKYSKIIGDIRKTGDLIMLNLNQLFTEKKLKFTKKQVNDGLYRSDHITKEQRDQLDSVDKAEEMRKKKGARKRI